MTIFSALSADVPTVRLSQYLPTLPETHSIAVFVGAMARGYVIWIEKRTRSDHPCRRDDFADGIVDEKISISNYTLSASVSSLCFVANDIDMDSIGRLREGAVVAVVKSTC